MPALRDHRGKFVGNLPVGARDVGRGPAHRTADLRESQELFRLAVESCPSGMVMIDGAGKIILLNSAMERLFGYPNGEPIGQPVDILVPERLQGRANAF
ncbi:MAG: PAS domain-containing protein [Hyphomicrobiales bacterium]